MIDDEDPGPPVCPGCHAVGPEPCPMWCQERQMQEEREFREEERDLEDEDYDD